MQWEYQDNFLIMSERHKIEFKYISRHWDKPFNEIYGYAMLQDIMTVFGYNEYKSKHIIREWFIFEIPEKFFNEDKQKEILKKWAKLGILDDLSGRSNTINSIFESQKKQLIDDEWFKEKNAFETIRFPIIRQVNVVSLCSQIQTELDNEEYK